MLFENTNLSQDSIYKSKIIVRINIDEIQQTVQSFIWMIVYQKKKKKRNRSLKSYFTKHPQRMNLDGTHLSKTQVRISITIKQTCCNASQQKTEIKRRPIDHDWPIEVPKKLSKKKLSEEK